VVASRVGGIPEVVQHGVSGFLHAPDDLDGMADSTVRMLEDPELHRRIALAARRTAVERFSDNQIVPLYESYYEEVLLAPSRA
jgi:glycosyltransferase involved in cell wall biosynthesis